MSELKPWHMGTHLRVLKECYPMITNITGLRWFSRIVGSLFLDKSSLSNGRVNGVSLVYVEPHLRWLLAKMLDECLETVKYSAYLVDCVCCIERSNFLPV